MDEEVLLRRIVAEKGVFLRREAEALGYDDTTIQKRRGHGRWVRVRHGAYTLGDLWKQADEMERFRTHGRAVLRTHDPRGMLSHSSAIAQHRIEMWGADLAKSHVTRYDGSVGRNGKDVLYHRGVVEPYHRATAEGIAVTAIPRAVVEHALVSSVESGLVTASAALHKKLTTTEELQAAQAEMAHWQGALTADLALRLADERLASVGEARAYYMMWSQGIPMPELQYVVRDETGAVVGVADFAWPEYGLLGEFDGRVKYLRYLRPGEEPGDAVFREKRREDDLRRLTGWPMIRIVWTDLDKPDVVAARIRSLLRSAA